MMRPVVEARFRTPWATPGGIRTSREAPAPSVSRMRAPAVRDPCRTSSRTTSIRSAGGDVPDVGLAEVNVIRLDDPGLHLAVVHLADGEARERRHPSVHQPRQLRHGATVVVMATELDHLDALDRPCGRVRLDLEHALGLGTQLHERLTLSDEMKGVLRAQHSKEGGAHHGPRRS